MKKNHPDNARGNVLLIIMIAIVLFAALAFAITSNRNDMQHVATAEEAMLSATEMIQHGDSLRVIIDKMISVDGVEDTNANSNGLLFAHANANVAYGNVATQPTTQVFGVSGGGINYIAPPPLACGSPCGAYEFTGQITVQDVETTAPDLAMVLTGIEINICEQVNQLQKTGLTSIPTEDPLTLTRFTGTYGGAQAITLSGAGNVLAGKRSFCYKESGGGGSNRYIFVHVLRGR
jgi:hypothetical protein